MTCGGKEIDWSDDRWKEMLVNQRKFMWREDTLAMLATWLGIKPGMTAVDVGCGLGYLGYTYWPFFGAGGRYFGIDKSHKLLRDATAAAKGWATDGEARFVTGDLYRMPFPDGIADWVMCQVVMIHLKDPGLALSEMVRVAKPGGLVTCIEPDNLSNGLTNGYWSVPEFSVEDQLLRKKVTLICSKGRIKLGRGNDNIAPKIPNMMKELGLLNIEIRNNDRVQLLLPPYEGAEQQHHLAMMKKQLLDEKNIEFWLKSMEEEFVAGGGTQEEFSEMRRISDRLKPIIRQQMEDGTYASCGGNFFYVIKGRKPV